MAPDRMSEVGLATFRPSISGADPCWACAHTRPVSAFALIDPARPSEPESSEARSDRDVAVEIGAENQIEFLRLTNQQCREGIDDFLVVGHVGVLLRKPSCTVRETGRRS